jgi:hypothetical protein
MLSAVWCVISHEMISIPYLFFYSDQSDFGLIILLLCRLRLMILLITSDNVDAEQIRHLRLATTFGNLDNLAFLHQDCRLLDTSLYLG